MVQSVLLQMLPSRGAAPLAWEPVSAAVASWRDTASERMGVRCKERKEKGGSGGGCRAAEAEMSVVGDTCMALETSQKRRAGHGRDRQRGPARTAGSVGRRSAHASNGTGKNLDFSLAGKLGLEGEGPDRTEPDRGLFYRNPNWPLTVWSSLCSVNGCGMNE